MLHKIGALNSAQNRLFRNSFTSSFTSSSSVLYIYIYMCVCVRAQRESTKGELSGKTLLEFVGVVRVKCDVTEKIRKKYRSNKREQRFVCFVSKKTFCHPS